MHSPRIGLSWVRNCNLTKKEVKGDCPLLTQPDPADLPPMLGPLYHPQPWLPRYRMSAPKVHLLALVDFNFSGCPSVSARIDLPYSF